MPSLETAKPPLDVAKIGQIRTHLSYLDRQRMPVELRAILEEIGSRIKAELLKEEAQAEPPMQVGPYPRSRDSESSLSTLRTALKELRSINWQDQSLPALLEEFSTRVEQSLVQGEELSFFRTEVVSPLNCLQRALEEQCCTTGIFAPLYALVQQELTRLRSITDYKAFKAEAAYVDWRKILVAEIKKILSTIKNELKETRVRFAHVLHSVKLHNISFIYPVFREAFDSFPEYRYIVNSEAYAFD